MDSALGTPTDTFGKIAAMKALLPANYTDWNTCMYVPVVSNVPGFSPSDPGAPKQIDCAATDNYVGAATSTSCVATIQGLGYYDSDDKVKYMLEGDFSCFHAANPPVSSSSHPRSACLSFSYSGNLLLQL
jgi:hypothetical protein